MSEMSNLEKNIRAVLELNDSGRAVLRVMGWIDRWERLKWWLKRKWTGK
jgi:hypothetical protein